MIRSMSDFINEYNKYGNFLGSVKFDDWSDFKATFLAVKDTAASERDLVEKCGFKYDLYESIVHQSIYGWKDSVSTSLFHGLGEIGYKFPKAGDAVFANLLQQTRFLTVSAQNRFLNNFLDLETIKENGQIKRISGSPAYTLFPGKEKKFNNILRMLFIYQYWHNVSLKRGLKDKTIKLPKKLYRGIRTHNLYNNPKILELIKKHETKDMSWEDRRKVYTDILLDWIYKNNINKITDGRLLSFTSSKPTAEYFANGEGFILSIDPTKVEILTSELTAKEFQEPDYVSNRKEKEYIVRIPDGYKIKPEDIEIVDKEYLLAAKNPMVVQWLDHDDIYVKYKIGDKTIRAGYDWHSNERGSISFALKKEDSDEWNWSEGRNNFKKQYGFDPMPTPKNLNQITDLEIIKRKRW